MGIAEQHALTFAAGLACNGAHPVVAIYSTFLQRAYDQLIHDIALQNLPVTLAIDRGGLVGADGATHHGSFDLSFLLCVPNLLVMTPSDENECRQMLYTAYRHEGPAAVRYPRGGATGKAPEKAMQELPIGKAELRREGKKVAILAFGPLLHQALKAAETLDASVVNMRFAKPLDVDMIRKMATSHELLVTIEENACISGAGSEVARVLEENGLNTPLLRMGLPDHFVDHGDQSQLLRDVSLDAEGIRRQIEARLSTS